MLIHQIIHASAHPAQGDMVLPVTPPTVISRADEIAGAEIVVAVTVRIQTIVIVRTQGIGTNRTHEIGETTADTVTVTGHTPVIGATGTGVVRGIEEITIEAIVMGIRKADKIPTRAEITPKM